jgi:predicted DNA-binding transcriptional regulator AlpA
MNETSDNLLPAAKVRERFGGVSDMWLYRRLHDGSGFPRPIYIGQYRYWRVSEIMAWEAGLPREKPQVSA